MTWTAPKSQVGSGFVLSIRDRDADTSFDVDIGFERRRQANGARWGIKLQEVACVAVGEVVLQLAGGIGVLGRNIADGLGKVFVDALIEDDFKIGNDGIVVVDIY